MNKSSWDGEQDYGNTFISSFVKPPKLFLSLNVQNSLLDVPNKLIKLNCCEAIIEASSTSI